MATKTPRLPPVVASRLKNERESTGVEQYGADVNNEAGAYLAGMRLGSLQKEPRPGEAFRRPHTSSANIPRPLGLVPDRGEKMDLLKRLSKMLSPAFPASAPAGRARRSKLLKTEGSDEISLSTRVFTKETKAEGTDTSQNNPSAEKKAKNEPQPTVPHSVPFRLPVSVAEKEEEDMKQLPKEESLLKVKPTAEGDDSEYVDTLAKCNMKDYLPSNKPWNHHEPAAHSPRLGFAQTSPDGPKRSGKLGRVHNRSTSVEYVSFSGQAQLWNRELSDDRRNALGYEPCERCRLRGGRCSKCKAIRTGGGYIILDGSDLSNFEKIQRLGKRYTWGQGSKHGTGTEGKQGHKRHRSNQDLDGERNNFAFDTDKSEEAERHRSLLGAGGRMEGRGGEWRGLGSGLGDGGATGGADHRQGSTRYDTHVQDGSGRGTHNREYGDQSARRGMSGTEDEGALGRGRVGSALRRSGDGREEADGHDRDSGRQSSTSQRAMSASRPGSTLGSRPGSSMKRVGRNWERKDRQKRPADLKKQSQDGRDRYRGRRDGSGSESGDDDGKGRQRRRRKRGEDGDEQDLNDGDDRDRSKFQYQRDSDEEEESKYQGDLMRFKRKKDNVKAIQATLQELQGIDPLDYLARYCIIDQEKLPHYRRSFDNVDRDEDDEIDIMELDFALKAVNYDLISDAEMNYVHSVLELAGRHRLNFRLFSLIAALSEKVVALDDMVKRLINKMDFEALEVKIKKCKELFYLLADAESTQYEGGVVTTSSLAVELQAGGLTHEHVEFVVDRLNHDNKGLVEFLDYLTYVPLFVEIHDSISGNPLDFTRTK